jgi:hypothetical protein
MTRMFGLEPGSIVVVELVVVVVVVVGRQDTSKRKSADARINGARFTVSLGVSGSSTTAAPFDYRVGVHHDPPNPDRARSHVA